MEDNRTVVLAVEKLLKRIRRLEKSNQFIKECLNNCKIPVFARIGKTARRKLLQNNISPNNIRKMERKSMYAEERKNKNKMNNLQADVNSQFGKLRMTCSDNKHFENLKLKIMGRVVSSETNRDQNRDRKLEKILNSDQEKFPTNKLELINLTPHEIPTEIQDFLQYGRNTAIGGSQPEHEIFLEVNDVFDKFKTQAKSENISDTDIHAFKCHSFIAVQNIQNSYTVDPRVKKFLDFKKLNDSLFIFVDKSPNLCYITNVEYDKKLADLFVNKKFEKIENFVIEKELVAFRKLIRETIGTNISNIKFLDIKPKNTISEAYGQIKMHKVGQPLRPLVPGHSSLTNNVEKYLKPILAPMLKECSYLVNSTKEFKSRFMVEKDKFDPEKHELMCLDIKSLYPSVNVNRVLSFILELLYANPKKYFPEEFDSDGLLLPIPSRVNFLKLMKYTLTKFSIFRTRIGVFRQLDGLAMGSCLSSIISNLFVNMLENSVVAKFEKSGDIISWVRYADDCCIIIKKGSFNKIFEKINGWEKICFSLSKK